MRTVIGFGETVCTQESLVLLVLDAFAKRGLQRVRQYELHKAICDIAQRLQFDFRFITSPTIYSDDLDKLLREMERSRLLNELLIVHNGWVPKRVYELTSLGRIVAAETEQRISREGGLVIEKIAEVLATNS